MTAISRFILSLTILIVCAVTIHPCTCSEPGARADFRSARPIFVGKVLSIRDREGPGLEIRFKVEKRWKGHRDNEATAFWEGIGPCGGFLFETGRTFLVYAREKEMSVYTSCDRTARIDNASEDIKKLNSLWFRLFARLIPF